MRDLDMIVALSGGVDSGVAATLLLDGGFRISGLYMRHRYQPTVSAEENDRVLSELSDKSRVVFCSVDDSGNLTFDADHSRPSYSLPVDAVSAINLASQLGVVLFILDVDRPFNAIVENFVEEYYLAHTPNPCALCNKTIKFGVLYDVARQLGSKKLATGHYARKMTLKDWRELVQSEISANEGENARDAVLPEWLAEQGSREFFLRSNSPKDQTYFLYNVSREILPNVVFPLGEMNKDDVRRLAQERGLQVASRKDSQEVCFIPDKQRLDFIRSLRETKPERWQVFASDTTGAFVSLDGKVIGRHNGYEKYTVGQRKGLGMGFGERIFVQNVDSNTRQVTLGAYEALATNEIRAVDPNWFADVPLETDFRCEIKIRYRNESCMATARWNRDGSVLVVPDAPRFGVAPGQALVCYCGDVLLGGARIVKE